MGYFDQDSSAQQSHAPGFLVSCLSNVGQRSVLALLPEYINKMAEHVLPFCKMGRASVDGSLKVLFGSVIM